MSLHDHDLDTFGKAYGQSGYWRQKITKLLIDYQDRDPDAVSKDKEFRIREHDNLFWKMETHLIMHDLAYEYYWQRAFFLNVLILVMGVTISIVGILQSIEEPTIEVTEDGIEITGNVADVTFFTDDGGFDADGGNATFRMLQEAAMSVDGGGGGGPNATQWIAILGILITFLKSFESYFGYQGRSDLHESAVTTLKDICDELFTTRLDVDLLCDECDPNFPLPEGHPRPTEEMFQEKRAQIKTCKAKFDTMQKSCSDPIPPQIKNQFIELREVLKLAPYDLKFFLYRRYYHKIAQRIRKSYLKITPPVFLNCFFVDDIYQELYHDAHAFICKWMAGDDARVAADFHPEKIRSAKSLENSATQLVADTQEMAASQKTSVADSV